MKSRPNRMFATTIAGLVWLGLVSVEPSVAQVTWSESLHLGSQTNIANMMSAPVSDSSTGVAYTNGAVDRQIKTCQDYLDSISAGFYPKDNTAQGESGRFAFRCYVFRDLQGAKAATSGSPYYWTSKSLSDLPPILAVGAKDVQIAAEKAEQHGINWQQYNPGIKVTSIRGDHMQVEDEDNYYTLIILARGDFNGDGAEDFAVFGTVKGKKSSWVSDEYMIFTQTPAGKLVRLTSDKIPYQFATKIPN